MTTSLWALGATGGSRLAKGGSRRTNGRRLPTRASLRSRLVFLRRTRPVFSGLWKGREAGPRGSMVSWNVKIGWSSACR
uniref:Uncharacterized protein n=1 Tax=Equus asinus TaxID=9793 RepID=A0A8C4LA75_EQUAS